MAIMKVMPKLQVDRCQYLALSEMASLEDRVQVANLANQSVGVFKLWAVKFSSLSYMPRVLAVNIA